MILVMRLPIYLDHNATTPLAPGVVEKMTLFLGTEFGNPSSGHATARRSGRPSPPPAPRSPVLLGRNRSGFVFIGCGSEANTLAICGVTVGRGGHVITQATEHPAVMKRAKPLLCNETATQRNL